MKPLLPSTNQRRQGHYIIRNSCHCSSEAKQARGAPDALGSLPATEPASKPIGLNRLKNWRVQLGGALSRASY
jgi:hypothetical protein